MTSLLTLTLRVDLLHFWRSIILLKKLQYARLIVSLGVLARCVTLLISVLDVSTTLKEILDNI